MSEREKGIIEKLGITPGPWKHSDGMGYIYAQRVGGCQMKMQTMTVANTRGWGCLQYHGEEKANAEINANEYLIASAPEMLEALIEHIYDYEEALEELGDDFEEEETLKEKRMKAIRSIQKATNKTWSQIKELL